MDYIYKLIDGMTIAELEAEKKAIYEQQYKFGGIDKPRLWDIEYTIKMLNSQA